MAAKCGTSLCLILGDLHFGKTSHDFNIDLAHERVVGVPHKLAGHPNTPQRFDEIRVFLTGDMGEGNDVHATQNVVTGTSTVYQVDMAADALHKCFLGLADYFSMPIVVETCPGNHGRQSKTAHPESNWDNSLYKQLELYEVHNKRVRFIRNYAEFNPVLVQGTRGLLYHRGERSLGTSKPRERFIGHMLRWGATWMATGHCHRAAMEPCLGYWKISTGSLGGPDSLADRMGVFEPPRQSFFAVTKGTGPHGFGVMEWSLTNACQR